MFLSLDCSIVLPYAIFPSALWDPLIAENHIGLLPLCPVCRNSVGDICFNIPIILDHRHQIFEFFNLFDWLAAKMHITFRSLLSPLKGQKAIYSIIVWLILNHLTTMAYRETLQLVFQVCMRATLLNNVIYIKKHTLRGLHFHPPVSRS